MFIRKVIFHSGYLTKHRVGFIYRARLTAHWNDSNDDVNRPFLVKPDALLVNLKALRFVARNDSGKVLISVEPPIASIHIDNQVEVVNSKQCAGDVRYNPVTAADGSVTVTVNGQLGDGCSSQTYLSLLDHYTRDLSLQPHWHGGVERRTMVLRILLDAHVTTTPFYNTVDNEMLVSERGLQIA